MANKGGTTPRILSCALWVIIGTNTAAQSATTTSCLFNSTHCSCSEIQKYPGNCLRPESRSSCLVDKCSDKGFVCDCGGTDICVFESCEAWVSASGTSNAFLPRGQTVECTQNESTQCLKRTGGDESPALPGKEMEYRMVQFGPSLESTMFNMTAFQFTMYLVVVDKAVKGEFMDLQSAKAKLSRYPKGANSPSRLVAEVIDGVVQKDPNIVGGEDQSLAAGFNKYWQNRGDFNRLIKVGQDYIDQPTFMFNLHGKWTHAQSLHARYINMRLYEESGSIGKILCAVYNTYGISDDGLGGMKVKVTITGTSGQTLEWLACDDRGECDGKKGKKLAGLHVLYSRLSDGWCVKPVEWNGNAIKVQFSEVEGMKGVVMQSTAGSEKVFNFGDGRGMKGDLDSNGLVRGGSTPDIVFNLKGIELPS